ncbi:MAG: RND superfamily putative drug exporter [Candidatus Aldehydirespiratoraceae bacterium]|jgi:RND superfamily putative drug exporter
MVARVGSWCFKNRGKAVLLWITALVTMGVAISIVGDGFDAEQSIPGSETEEGFAVLDEYFGGVGNGLSGQIVFTSEQGIDDPIVAKTMTTMFRDVGELEFVTVASPYTGNGGGISPDNTVAFADVNLSRDVSQEESGAIGEEIIALIPTVEGLTVEIGGEALAEFAPPETELIGIAFAIIVLIIATGSVLAMGLSIGAAVIGVGGGVSLTILMSNLTGGPTFATTFAVMIGLGVGIDYSLFIITRYRDELHKGRAPSDAIAVAMATAGRAVLFAGITVVFSLLGLIAIGLPFVTGIGVSTSAAVLVTLISSLTLLPAFLGFADDRIEISYRRGMIAAALIAVGLFGAGLGIGPLLIALPLAVAVLLAGLVIAPLRTEIARREPKPLKETLAYRWSRFVQSRPWTVAIIGTSLLLVLTAPLLGLRLGFSDEGNKPEDTTTRQAYDLVAEGFGPGFNGPFLVTALTPDDEARAQVDVLVDSLQTAPGVVSVFGPSPNPGTDLTTSDAVILRVIPSTAPQDIATEDLVGFLRDDVIPVAVDGTALDVALTGNTAAGIDFSDYLAARTFFFFGAVLIVSFLLLMAVFRSILVPLKAVIMNLLSISAAYGVVVAVFQWGWLSDITNVSPAPIEPFIPMMMFAIVFGLSMDYEVFLISRIREEYDRTGDAMESVADGLASTARVITAAAAIMAVVFGSFLLEEDRVIQLMGTGLASAIILDATLVRMLLVPATMELLGSRNWWIPAWLDRILPQINLEGPAAKT